MRKISCLFSSFFLCGRGLGGISRYIETVRCCFVCLSLPFRMQCAGLGPLRPNTVVLGWPTPGQENIRWGETLVQTLIDCERLEMAVLVCRGLENFPSSRSSLPMSGSLDLWWIIRAFLINFCLFSYILLYLCMFRKSLASSCPHFIYVFVFSSVDWIFLRCSRNFDYLSHSYPTKTVLLIKIFSDIFPFFFLLAG